MKAILPALILSLLLNTAPAQEAPAEAPGADLMTMVQDARCRQVIVTCLVNNRPMRMMLDTGATHTVLHRESAEKLEGVRWLDTSKMNLKGNSQQRPGMLIAPLAAGPAEAPQHLFMVLDLSAVRSAMAESVDGILGMDILGLVPFTFDQRRNELYWGVPEQAKPVPLNGRTDATGRFIISAVCGGRTTELLLDTGSSVTRVNAEDWAPGAAEEVQAHVGNVDTAAVMKVTEGKPGDTEIAPGVILRGLQPIFGQPGEPPVLGMDALRNVTLIHLPMEGASSGVFFVAE